MDQEVKVFLEGIRTGDRQSHRNAAVYPLFSEADGGPEYLTLKEAIEGGFLRVTEVSEGGAVPELKVVNGADAAVLVLDGEELAGAKQNRIVNTTILLRGKSETIIPVSCTEQGRWSYVSAQFDDSGHIATRSLREVNKQSVAASLRARGDYRSDQGAVWDNVQSMLRLYQVDAPTAAMKDAFESKAGDVDEYLEKFPRVPGQQGLLVLIDGKVAGMDVVSRESAYAVLHPKLVKSYVMEALVSGGRKKSGPDDGKVKAFMAQALSCAGRRFKSVGHGWDCRLQGKNIVGSALVYKKTVVHAAFFLATDAEKAGHMSGWSHRRGFRS